jgi:hypothetical protein
VSRGTDFGPWSCPSVAIVCLQSPPAGSRQGSGAGAARCKDSQPEARACCKGVTCASPPQAQKTQQLVTTTLLQAACIPTGAASSIEVPVLWWILPHSDRGSRDCILCQPICLSDRVLVIVTFEETHVVVCWRAGCLKRAARAVISLQGGR